MSIQFACGRCGKLLTTRDEAAGKSAKCPECQAITTVPGGARAGAGRPDAQQSSSREWHASQSANNPFQSPGSPPETASATAYESFGEPSPVEIGDVWKIAWARFTDNIGVCLAAFLFPLAMNITLWFASLAIVLVTNSLQGREAANAAYSILNLVTSLVSIYLVIGQRVVMLNAARGNEARFSDLFAHPMLALKVAAGWLLLVVAIVITAITIVGPFIVLLMFWPYAYIMIERNPSIGKAFSLAYETTRGNRLSVLGLAVVTWLCSTAAALVSCGLGLLVIIPVTMLVFPVAYLIMTGRRSAIPMRS